MRHRVPSHFSWTLPGVGHQPTEEDGGVRCGNVQQNIAARDVAGNLTAATAAAGNPRQRMKLGAAISMSHALLFQID